MSIPTEELCKIICASIQFHIAHKVDAVVVAEPGSVVPRAADIAEGKDLEKNWLKVFSSPSELRAIFDRIDQACSCGLAGAVSSCKA